MQKDPLAAGELLASQGLWQGAIERLLRERRPEQQPCELPIKLRERLAGYYQKAIAVRRHDKALDQQCLIVELRCLVTRIGFCGQLNSEVPSVHEKMMTSACLRETCPPSWQCLPDKVESVIGRTWYS